MDVLTDKVAVITGGASGIGLATAKALAGEGMRLVLADVEKARLDAAVADLASSGAEVVGVVCDVGDRASVESLADTAFERMSAVHLLFNNAGIALGGPMLEMQHSDWEWTLQVNLWGPIHGVESFVSRMVAQGEPGHVLFTSSFAGLVPNEELGPYCVSKYGVVAIAEVLQRELRGTEVGVSVLCPMRVETAIGESEMNRPAEFGGPSASPGVADQDADNQDMAGGVLGADDVAALVIEAVKANRLYILPHAESRVSIRRRFERIDRTFEQQGG
jgi:NAD(P)-dependent dehydrogenase (short-subunit alcohol dehydrogenase family)